jgi:hypothetical protein
MDAKTFEIAQEISKKVAHCKMQLTQLGKAEVSKESILALVSPGNKQIQLLFTEARIKRILADYEEGINQEIETLQTEFDAL